MKITSMVYRENTSALLRSNGAFVADGGSFIKTPETYPFLKILPLYCSNLR